MMKRFFVLCVLMVSAAGLYAADFQGIGDLPGGFFTSECTGISGDGSTVTGFGISANGQEAFRWTKQTGMQGLGDLAGGGFQSGGRAVSQDGSVIIGQSSTTNSGGTPSLQPFHWTQATGIQPLTTTGVAEYGAWVSALSADGSQAVGYVNDMYNRRIPAYWSNGAMQLLIPPDYPATPSPFTDAQAVDLSPDGSQVLLHLADYPVIKNYLWNQANGYTELISMNDGIPVALSHMSGNQEYYAGTQTLFDPHQITQGLIWSENGGLVAFDRMDGLESSFPADISYDGSIVVGRAMDMRNWNTAQAFIWTENEGINLLADVLANSYGLGSQLAGWTLTDATGISDDGMTLCGYGINPEGNQEGWVVTLPEPASLLLLGIGGLILRSKRIA